MPVPYSEDLRRKIIQACERGTESQRQIAEWFSVSQSFVESVWHHYRHSGGECVPHRRRAGRHPRLDEACHEKLRGWLEEQSDLTLQELIDRLGAAMGIVVSEPTMCRVLQQLGMRRKKRHYMPRNGTVRAYVWHAADTGGKSTGSRSKS